MKSISLNADVGESFGAWTMGNDAALFDIVTDANIACGFHAGDPAVMTRTVAAAADKGVSIGAHPSFPDLQGFGRRRMSLTGDEVMAAVIYQLGALAGIARAAGRHVRHVKPHGALSNMASEDIGLARPIAEAIRAFDPALILIAPIGSALARAGEAAGLDTAGEIFADRTYRPDGHLTPRTEPDAVIHDPVVAAAHVHAMLMAGGAIATDGTVLAAPVHSICVHGDRPDAIEIARAVRDVIRSAGFALRPLPEILTDA